MNTCKTCVQCGKPMPPCRAARRQADVTCSRSCWRVWVSNKVTGGIAALAAQQAAFRASEQRKHGS